MKTKTANRTKQSTDMKVHFGPKSTYKYVTITGAMILATPPVAPNQLCMMPWGLGPSTLEYIEDVNTMMNG